MFQRLIGVGGEGVSTTYVTGCRLCLFASKINGSIWACWKVFKCRFLAIFASRGSPLSSSVGGFSFERGAIHPGFGWDPDRQAVAYVLQCLQQGFRLGFQPSRRLKAAKKNKPSAFQNPRS